MRERTPEADIQATHKTRESLQRRKSASSPKCQMLRHVRTSANRKLLTLAAAVALQTIYQAISPRPRFRNSSGEVSALR